MSDMVRMESHTYRYKADQSVRSAMHLMNKLPNGWSLKEIGYTKGSGSLLGEWWATVESPTLTVE